MDENLDTSFLSRLEGISCAAKTCDLDFRRLEEENDDIKEVALFMGITSDQAVLFACLAELSFQKPVTLDILSKHLSCTVFRLLSYMNQIEALENKGYIRKSIRKKGRSYSYYDIGFMAPHSVIEALRKGDPSRLSSSVRFALPGFLKQVNEIVEDRHNDRLTTEQSLTEIGALIAAHTDLPFVSYIDSSLSETVSKCSVFTLGFKKLKGQVCDSISGFAGSVYEDMEQQLGFAHQVVAGTHELVKKNFVRVYTTGYEGDKAFALTDNIARVLFTEYPELLVSDRKDDGLILHGTLPDKELFFSGGLREQTDLLEEVLMPGKFRAYREELKRNKLNEGITAIFYGAPGTGKTEMVYRLARRTGRDIMMVDLSATKSKWFGESEKMVRKIFDDYSALLKSTLIEPILFINEADGLFTKRIDLNTSRGGSTEQSLNTIQNILLQALENFEGILMATTNLTDNLDKAFERRFTFRIDFPKPDAEVRQVIWKNKIPELSDKDASVLGEKFELTGGEIDIHVRQIILKKVLSREFDLFEALVDSCSRDRGFLSRKPVGF